jgi:hypothetical protein
MRAWRWIAWMSCIGSLAVGCGGGSSAQGVASKPTPKGQPVAAKAAPPALPAVKPRIPEPGPPLPPLAYEAKGRRDPFVPVQVVQEKAGLDVSTLKLVGIINGRQLLALVEAPNGLGYILKPGDVLGDGHVSGLTTDSVTFVIGGRSSPQETSVTLRLPGD